MDIEDVVVGLELKPWLEIGHWKTKRPSTWSVQFQQCRVFVLFRGTSNLPKDCEPAKHPIGLEKLDDALMLQHIQQLDFSKAPLRLSKATCSVHPENPAATAANEANQINGRKRRSKEKASVKRESDQETPLLSGSRQWLMRSLYGVAARVRDLLDRNLLMPRRHPYPCGFLGQTCSQRAVRIRCLTSLIWRAHK